MSFLTEQVKADLLRDIESFAETTDRFYKKEVSIRDYKGYSGVALRNAAPDRACSACGYLAAEFVMSIWGSSPM